MSFGRWFAFGYGGMDPSDEARLLREDNGSEVDDDDDPQRMNDAGRYMPLPQPERMSNKLEDVLAGGRKRRRIVSSSDDDDSEGGGEEEDAPAVRSCPINVSQCSSDEVPPSYGGSMVALSDNTAVYFGGVDISRTSPATTNATSVVVLSSDRMPKVWTASIARRSPLSRCCHCAVPLPDTRAVTENHALPPPPCDSNVTNHTAEAVHRKSLGRFLLFGGNSHPMPSNLLEGRGHALNDFWIGEVTELTFDSSKEKNATTATAEEAPSTRQPQPQPSFPLRGQEGGGVRGMEVHWHPVEGINLPSPRYASAMAVLPPRRCPASNTTTDVNASTSAAANCGGEEEEDEVVIAYCFGGHGGYTPTRGLTAGLGAGTVPAGDVMMTEGGVNGVDANTDASMREHLRQLEEQPLLDDLVRLTLRPGLRFMEGKVVETLGSRPLPRCGHTMVYTNHRSRGGEEEGTLFVFGGVDNRGTPLPELYSFNLATKMWRDVSLPYNYVVPARAFHSCVVSSLQHLIFIGGESRGLPVQTTWEYVPLTEDWVRVDFPLLQLPSSKHFVGDCIAGVRPPPPSSPTVSISNPAQQRSVDERSDRSPSHRMTRTATTSPSGSAGSTIIPSTVAVSFEGDETAMSTPTTVAAVGSSRWGSSAVGGAGPGPPGRWVLRSGGPADGSVAMRRPDLIDRSSGIAGTGCSSVALAGDVVLVLGGRIGAQSSLLHAQYEGLPVAVLHVETSLKHQVAMHILMQQVMR